ncbi:MAG: hypothetical protein DRP96_01705 [Candidatus Neomarinimicrobiota bacterium]|nr:MAG: hypothetical protein DRP96_01705 [Candidatus Neomarinimicrobiota bacterium]
MMKLFDKSQLLYVIILVLLIALPCAGKVTKVGTTMGQFLKIGIGARSIGMGGAVVASVNDATAVYWNPSVIAGFNKRMAFASYTDWLLDTKLTFTGVVLPMGTLGSFGFYFNSLSMGMMDVRTVELPEGTGEQFTVGNLAMGVSYARKLTNFFSIGFNAKYIRESIWHCNATSIAFDFGSQYCADNGRLIIGTSVSNFGNKMQFTGKDLRIYYDQNTSETGDNEYIPAYYETDKWDLPLLFRIGLAVYWPEFPVGDIVAEFDAIHPNDNSEQINLGAEWNLNQVLFVRTGYQALFQENSEQGLTVGGGLRYKLLNSLLTVNYAYADFGRLPDVQRIDIGIDF